MAVFKHQGNLPDRKVSQPCGKRRETKNHASYAGGDERLPRKCSKSLLDGVGIYRKNETTCYMGTELRTDVRSMESHIISTEVL